MLELLEDLYLTFVDCFDGSKGLERDVLDRDGLLTAMVKAPIDSSIGPATQQLEDIKGEIGCNLLVGCKVD